MSEPINTTNLCQEWVHSREEDNAEETVFRPPDYSFPLTRRPRDYFHLSPDGSLVKGDGSPSDQLQKTNGSWKLDKNEIEFQMNTQPILKRLITSVEPNKLVLKK